MHFTPFSHRRVSAVTGVVGEGLAATKVPPLFTTVVELVAETRLNELENDGSERNARDVVAVVRRVGHGIQQDHGSAVRAGVGRDL